MPAPDTFWTYFGAVAAYVAVLAVPGGLIGWAAGLRGWALAGLSPLLSYAVTGLAGPWLALVGLPYNVLTAAACTLLLAGVAFGIRRLCLVRGWITPGAEAPPVIWTKRAHWAVAACVVVAVGLSIAVVLSARGGTTAVFQRWDTVYHANGIRYIAETGDGSLTGMSTINWYPNGSFYPNGYHLVAALVYEISGTSIPVTLNAVTMPIAGIFALSMVALIRQMGGRAVHAGCTALIASAATTGAYESVSSGLLPYALGVVLTPLMVVSLQRFLVRPAIDTGIVFALTADGLLVSHSSALFGGALLAAPLVLQRWYRSLRRLPVDGVPEGRGGFAVIGRDVLYTIPVMVVAVVLGSRQILGAIGFTDGAYPYNPWNSHLPVVSALKMLATFQQVLNSPQLWLTALLVLGTLSFLRLGRMRWVLLSAIGLSGLFVLVTSYGNVPLVITLSRPWWNDRFRLMALAAIPLCLLAGHGMAEAQRWIARLVRSVNWAKERPQVVSRLGIAAAAVVIAVTAVLTGGFYRTANATAVSFLYYNGPEGDGSPPVNQDEIIAMDYLGRMGIPSDQKVLNDRLDGTAWMYALAGVHPVAGHYDGSGAVSPDANYLAEHFRDFDRDPHVRESLRRLNVHHVLIGSGAIAKDAPRAAGLRDLEGSDFLKLVYRNPGAQIYTIVK